MAKRPKPEGEQIGLVTPFGLRLLPDLRAKLDEACRQSGRSLNSEIVARLEETFSVDGTVVQQLERQAKMLDYLTQVTQRLAAAFDDKTGLATDGVLSHVQDALREYDASSRSATTSQRIGAPDVPPAKSPKARKSRKA